MNGLAVEALIDLPLTFHFNLGRLGNRIYQIQNISLGKYLILKKDFAEMGINIESEKITEFEYILITQKTTQISTIIAKAMLDTRQEILNGERVKEIAKLIDRHFDKEAYIYAIQGIKEKIKINHFVDFFDIKKEIEKRNNQKHDYESVGGKTIWGSIIHNIANKYHWTFDYILWGITWQNLQMIMFDETWIDYESKETQLKHGLNRAKTKNRVQKLKSFEDFLGFAGTKTTKK